MIEINNLNFAYGCSHPVFRNLNVTIEKGGVCGILGRNGAGKTTLFNLISGLVFAQKGSKLSVMGFDPKKRSVEFLQKIFLLPEEFALPQMTVNDYVECYGKFYPNFSILQMHQILTSFEVSSTDKFNQMSFGQRKKAYIAFALASNTPLLLLDEPTNGLDIPAKAAFRRAMAGSASDQRTILISTHQVRDLEETLDSVIIIDEDKILLQATTSQIARRLRFEIVDDQSETLYCQPAIYGLLGVVENHDQYSETALDLELLFNAVITSPDKIEQLFLKNR